MKFYEIQRLKMMWDYENELSTKIVTNFSENTIKCIGLLFFHVLLLFYEFLIAIDTLSIVQYIDIVQKPEETYVRFFSVFRSKNIEINIKNGKQNT